MCKCEKKSKKREKIKKKGHLKYYKNACGMGEGEKALDFANVILDPFLSIYIGYFGDIMKILVIFGLVQLC